MKELTENEILYLSKRKFFIWLKNFLKDIPKDQWTINIRTDSQGRHCVLGHLDVRFKEVTGIVINLTTDLSKPIIHDGGAMNFNIAAINNGQYMEGQFKNIDNPKDRVIKYLNLRIANKKI